VRRVSYEYVVAVALTLAGGIGRCGWCPRWRWVCRYGPPKLPCRAGHRIAINRGHRQGGRQVTEDRERESSPYTCGEL
jgi:hypothetical protein